MTNVHATLGQQILDLESLIKALTFSSGATPDEIARLQAGLDRLRRVSEEQQVAEGQRSCRRLNVKNRGMRTVNTF